MFNRYQHKIKTIQELRALIGHRPRKNKVVMCHGVFDIVHPGHIRHLLYAKGLGDILVASLTSDEHVSKGVGRPYVPQDLRAANLAALEVVDYVLVDAEPEPIANIIALQPDFFVKGFEYSAGGIHPKSQKEMEAVSSYGGEFLFSPGDVVYSSTQLLAMHRPSLALDKLVTLMQAEGISFKGLAQTMASMPGARVHVVGDMIVDKYSHCTVLGPSTKTPTFSVKLEGSRLYVGGAGIVAKHLRSLGAEVTVTSIVGDDGPAEFVAQDLEDQGIRLNKITDSHRPTTVKERYWAGNYKLLQVDTVDNSPISDKHTDEMAVMISETATDLVVFSDFRHGIFHVGSTPTLAGAIPSSSLKVADSQVSSRWGNILEFRGFDLITPNEHEARFALGDQDSGVRHLAQRLISEADAGHAILKLGERGVLVYRSHGVSPRSFFHLDSFVDVFVDSVGAGDALLAAASLALLRTEDIVQSAILGNVAAAVACGVEGNMPIKPDAILGRLSALEALAHGESFG